MDCFHRKNKSSSNHLTQRKTFEGTWISGTQQLLCTFLVVLFATSFSVAQNLHSTLNELVEQEQFRKIDSILDTISNPDILAEQAYTIATAIKDSNPDLSAKYYTRSIDSGSLTNYPCRSQINLANIYSEVNNLDAVESILNDLLNSECDSLYKAIAKSLSTKNYFELGDYGLSIVMGNEALEELPVNTLFSYTHLAHLNLGFSLSAINSSESAIEVYSEGINFFNKVNSTFVQLKAELLIARAQEYEELEFFGRAEIDFKKAIEINNTNENNPILYHSKDQLGLLYSSWGKHDQAMQMFNEVIAEKDNPNNKRYYNALANKADLLYETGKTKEALSLYEQSLQEFLDSEGLSNSTTQVISKKDVLNQLIQEYLQKLPKTKNQEQKVEELLHWAELLAEETLYLTSKQSIYDWRSKLKPTYEAAIAYYSGMNDVENVFGLIEQSKAVVFFQEIQLNNFSDEDETTQRLRQSILQKEAELELAEFNQEERSELFLEIGSLKDSLSSQLQLQPLQSGLHINLASTQAKLKEQEMVLNAYWGETELYVVKVTNDTANLKTIPLTEEFTSHLSAFLEQLKQPVFTRTEVDRFNEFSNAIYTDLNLNADNITHLHIFPDGLLSYLPFESLWTGNQFLVEQTITDYGFSANTFFIQNEKENAVKNKKALAFAPIDYQHDLQLASLTNSSSELTALAPFKIQTITNQEATKQMFEDNVSGKRLLHISTHGAAGAETIPWIAAYDQRIYLPEIYQLNISSDLVVLSACETNIGKEVTGEGVISLSRGFMQAGAESVIASQWQVNERSTAEILTSFYRLLEEGYPKSQALQLAKKEFIETYPTQSLSPYYWAGLIYYGENESFQPHTKFRWIYLLGLLPIAGLLVYLLKGKKFSSKVS